MSEYGLRLLLFIVGMIVALVWLITNTYSFGQRLKILFTTRAFFWALAELLIFIPQIFYPAILPFSTGETDKFISFFGLLIYLAGALLAIWARLTLGESWGLPAQHNIEKQRQLITNGPYRISRHPIYLGLFLMLIGFELALKSLLVLLAIPIFYYLRRTAIAEEKLLKEHFGKKYSDYQSRTPRFL